MKRELIIGGGAIAAAGLIAGGIYLSQNNPFNIKPGQEDTEVNREKMEELYFEELKDTERYVFCVGKETIKGDYANSIMGNEKGEIDYVSQEVNLIDKESGKMYLLARSIDYNYQGQGLISYEFGDGTIDTKESGSLTEYYKKNDAPVHVDYNSGTVFPAPDRKSKDWVFVNVNMTGAALGAVQSAQETSKEDAKTFCPPVKLSSNPLESGAVITPESFSVSRPCDAPAVNPGVSFSGDYEFNCLGIDYSQAIELLKDYQAKEQLQNSKVQAGNEEGSEEFMNFRDETLTEGVAGSSIGEGVNPSQSGDLRVSDESEESRPSNDEMKKLLEEARQGIQADTHQ